MLFFTQMPTVVRPQTDDRIILVRTSVQSVDQSTELCVCEVDRCQVGLDRILPSTRFDDLGVVTVWLGHLDASSWDIIKIICRYFRQLDRLEWKLVEVLFRNAECHVGFDQPTGDKPRFVVLAVDLFNRTRDVDVIDHLLVGIAQRAKTNATHTAIGEVFCFAWLPRVTRSAAPNVPVTRVRIPPVVHLTEPRAKVTVIFEMSRQRDHVRQYRSPRIRIVINACRRWSQSCQQRRTRRIAGRHRTVGTGKRDTPTGQAIQRRCNRLRMTAKVSHPIVHVVNGDEQNVRSFRLHQRGTEQQHRE